jgi:hypothetical protein
MHGALCAVPVQAAALAAFAWAFQRRRDPAARALRRTIWAALLSSAFAACILFCYAGSASRYITELFAGATVASALGLMAIFSGPRGGTGRNVVRLLAAGASLWTVGYVALASAEHRILMRRTDPVAYGLAARLLDYPSLWVARRHGAVFGPVAIAIRLAPFRGPSSTAVLSAGRPGMMNQLIVERPDAGHARLLLAENTFSVVVATPLLPVGRGVLRAQVEAPWLYPPPQHPWWDGVADPALRRDLQTRFALTAGGASYRAATAHFFDPTRFEPWLVTRESAGGRTEWVEALAPLAVPTR